MAIKQNTAFVNFTPASAPETPFGSFKNETALGAKDGTEYIKDWPNDIYGYLQKLLTEGAVTPSGTPDNANISQYYEALKNIFGPNESENLLFNASCRGHVFYTEGTADDALKDTQPIWDGWRVLADTADDAKAAITDPAIDGYGASRKLYNAIGSTKFGAIQMLSPQDSSILIGSNASASITVNSTIADIRIGVITWSGAGSAPVDPISAWNAAGTNPTLVTNFAFVNTPAALSPAGTATYKLENLAIGSAVKQVGFIVWVDSAESAGAVLNIHGVQLNVGGAASAERKNCGHPRDINSNAPRSTMQWGSVTSVDMYGTNFPMAGFRSQGQYHKSFAPVYTASTMSVSISTDLDSMTSALESDAWYAVFMTANDGDFNCSPVIVPFIRLFNDAGTLKYSSPAEGQTKAGLTAITRGLNVNGLAGNDVLVISRDLVGGGFSYDVTRCVSNTTTVIVLEDESNITDGDWALPSPSGVDHYVYIGSFYVNASSQIRRFVDDGKSVKYRGDVDASSSSQSGAITLEKREVSGYVSPLASAVIIESAAQLTGITTGLYIENFYFDSNAASMVTQCRYVKEGSITGYFTNNNLDLPFNKMQIYGYETDAPTGMDTNRASSTQTIVGYVEH